MTDPTPLDFSRAAESEVTDVDAGRRWVVARINTDAVDRFDTVVSPSGMDRTEFLRNPVVLWEHGKDPVRGKVPIGRDVVDQARPRVRPRENRLRRRRVQPRDLRPLQG